MRQWFKPLAVSETGARSELSEKFVHKLPVLRELNQGSSLLDQGNYAEAIASFDEALGINPNNQDARETRDKLQEFVQQQPDEAIG
ncbi:MULTISPECIES: tetratricopeptide repeat protein [unclassified Coleofasciculus]|uniref:tetratricopeptide repeat protein n=1 Tax=unclassified Coleofasciculus TaxID=2692782 RepID=UPI00188182AF|nr:MULTISPECIES: tetratricopeptide repeat protein [unclassified Coleofasciculus]MBE9126304.1 tetratricopeptide repeat protein [Coleofasciculus sp. LEGE 07081]MBE9149223.1 tetratricopeptide repeat protein [Coleofasciculus sp. LEGE 07092]